MARITKLELEQINAALASDNAALRKQYSDALLTIEMLTSQSKAAAVGVRAARVMPAWQVERAATMALAKERAMAMRCVVKV